GPAGGLAPLPLAASGALRAMMIGPDVPEAAGSKAEHHRPYFVDRVPAQSGLQAAYRRKARAGVQLGGAAGMERGRRHLAPAPAPRFVQRGPGDSQARVLFQFAQ